MTTPTRPQADRPPFLDKTNPDVFAALGDVAGQVSDACEAAGLDRVDIELLNVAISQRNGCAYCTDLHTRRARKAGADQQLLDALPVWGESALFTDRQRAILDLGLTITSLPSPRRRRRAIRAGRAAPHRRPAGRRRMVGDPDERLQPGLDHVRASRETTQHTEEQRMRRGPHHE